MSGQARGGQTPELAILIGLQGSGKTTFYRGHLEETHAHVSKDLFGRSARNKQYRQLRQIAGHLEAGRDVAVDNTNPSPQEWAPLIRLGREHGARITGYWFPPDAETAMRRNLARPTEIRVPDVGFYATLKRLRKPRHADGFDALYAVETGDAGGFTVTEMKEGEGTGDAPARP